MDLGNTKAQKITVKMASTIVPYFDTHLHRTIELFSLCDTLTSRCMCQIGYLIIVKTIKQIGMEIKN